VILGFSTGAAVLIGCKQLPNFLGLALAQSGSFAGTMARVAAAVHEAHLITLALGLLTIGAILVLRKIKPHWPGTLIAMVLVGGIVAAFDLDRHGVAVVGAIPRMLPPFIFRRVH
jgi:SulP family sulfate permease